MKQRLRWRRKRVRKGGGKRSECLPMDGRKDEGGIERQERMVTK